MSKPAYFEADFPVVWRDSDCYSQCQAAALLSYLQETGLAFTAEQGLSWKYLLERYGLVWMLTRVHYTLDAPIRLGDTIQVRVWSREAHGMGFNWDFEIFRDGERLGSALGLWMLVNAKSRNCFPVSTVEEFSKALNPYPGKKKQLHRLDLPDGLVPVQRRMVRYSQADMNGHLNNSRYADFICDAIGMENLGGVYLSSLKISYLAECPPGTALELSVLEESDIRHVRGTGEDGTVRFEAEAKLGRP
jgi:acyl-ACP thioesterase